MVAMAVLAFAPSPLKKIEAEPAHKSTNRTETIQKSGDDDTNVIISTASTIKPFNALDRSTWPTCAADEFVRADNGQCAKKPVETPSVAQTASSGDCASELSKYDWPQTTAYRVMMQESSNNPGTLNDNPTTGDYSVGCFQINLYGANARTRPSEATLKVAANNVSYAYMLWKGTRSFYGHWPNTCKKVGC